MTASPSNSALNAAQVPSLTRGAIVEQTKRLLAQAGVEGNIPTPLEIIADTLGYHLRAFGNTPATERIAGAIDYDEKVIYLNAKDCLERRRFTLAHELGHAVLHPQHGNRVDYRDTTEGRPGDRREIQANKFAAELLMPEDSFRAVFAQSAGFLWQIAKHFAVSESAAVNRAGYLGL